MNLEKVSSFIYENFSNVSVSRSGTHWNFRCPFCGDSKKKESKKRFHVQYKSDDKVIYRCFNCPESGNFYGLYAFIKGIEYQEAYKELNKYDVDNIRNRLSSREEYTKTILFNSENNFDVFLKTDCLKWDSEPDGYKQKILLNILTSFKNDRKIDFDVYICINGEFTNRIIIPIFQDGHCVFFQGRRVNETDYPKYLNPSVEKENVLLNKNNFDRNEFIVVSEGILDAASVGIQGTSCLGASISDAFLEELFKYTDRGIILALDNDKTGIENISNIIKHSKYNKRLFYFFQKEYKDLNELYVKNNIEDLYKYVKDNKKSYLESYLHIKGI